MLVPVHAPRTGSATAPGAPSRSASLRWTLLLALGIVLVTAACSSDGGTTPAKAFSACDLPPEVTDPDPAYRECDWAEVGSLRATVVADSTAHERYFGNKKNVIHLLLANTADEPKELLLGTDLVVVAGWVTTTTTTTQPNQRPVTTTTHPEDFEPDRSFGPRYERDTPCATRVEVPPKGVAAAFVCYVDELDRTNTLMVTLSDWKLRPLRQERVVRYFNWSP